MTCPAPNELIETGVDRILTQYRESPKLLHVIRTYLAQVENVIFSICDLPSFFEIDTAVGDQLTLIGKRLGWPRCHCVCTVQPVFGFQCEGYPEDYPIAGLCEDNSTWADCDVFGIGEICINDDEMYRAFLRVRRYQILAFFDIQSLTDSIQTLWGETAMVLDAGKGRVVIAPGRPLSVEEESVLQLVARVLPVAPGIVTRFHFDDVKVFGFGDGWGGFCEELYPEGLSISPGDDMEIEIEPDGDILSTGPIYQGAPFMCEIDVKPYECG